MGNSHAKSELPNAESRIRNAGRCEKIILALHYVLLIVGHNALIIKFDKNSFLLYLLSMIISDGDNY